MPIYIAIICLLDSPSYPHSLSAV